MIGEKEDSRPRDDYGSLLVAEDVVVCNGYYIYILPAYTVSTPGVIRRKLFLAADGISALATLSIAKGSSSRTPDWILSNGR